MSRRTSRYHLDTLSDTNGLLLDSGMEMEMAGFYGNMIMINIL